MTDDSIKMLRAVINGQSSLKEELLGEIHKLDKEVKEGFKKVDDRFESLDSKLTKRIDKLGLQIASLEDDAPTIDEFDELAKKVTKIQKSLVLN